MTGGEYFFVFYFGRGKLWIDTSQFLKYNRSIDLSGKTRRLTKMPTDKNRFTSKTREILAKRAGHTCSNPHCNKPTSGPHSEDEKAVDIGEAAHIRGANPGSKRYDSDMTPTERSHIINGIWLCRNCAKLIDSDEFYYTVDLLYQWKRQHEAKINSWINSSEWNTRISDKELKAFENESSAAYQIVIDRPEHWEHLLTLELLRAKLKDVKRIQLLLNGKHLKISRKYLVKF